MTAPATPAEALRDAIISEDPLAVADVLARHPELRTAIDRPLPNFGFGATPLLGAVYRNNRQIVDILLDAGADINARSHWWAGSFGVLDHDGPLVDYLVARGAVVDVHAAARLGRLDRLRELLDSQPDLVHARGGDGQTPLHFARSVEVARFLLDRGADIDARDVDHESTPAQYMVRDRHDVARLLVARGCRTDILMAAALGDAALVERHLGRDPLSIRTRVSEEHFPKENARSGGTIYNWTLGAGKGAHVVAREFGHGAVFDLLWARSPDDLRLVVACEVDDAPTVIALLDARPDLPATLAPADRRRLPDAVRDGKGAAARLMLRAGWPIDAPGQHGGTALHWAAWHGDASLVLDLLRRGAAVAVVDADYGGTPLDWAIHASRHGWHPDRGDYAGTVAALLEAGASCPEPAAADASPAVRDVLARAWSRRSSPGD